MIRFPRKKTSEIGMWILISGMILFLFLHTEKVKEDITHFFIGIRDYMMAETVFAVEKMYYPLGGYAREGNDSDLGQRIEKQIIPLWNYVKSHPQKDDVKKGNAQYLSLDDINEILLQESMETENYYEDTTVSENASAEVSNNESLYNLEEMERENRESVGEFYPAKEKSFIYAPEVLTDPEKFLQAFYIVDKGTYVKSGELKYETLMEKDMTLKTTPEEPQILIYHTHSQEGFADSVAGDLETTVVGVGERLAENLRAYGYHVYHHKGVYDLVRDKAYGEALPAIEQLLREYPGIEVVIDLHRDQVASDRKLAVDMQGRKTAQIMFFNGLSRTKDLGDIGYLQNDNLAWNLAFSFQMQKCADEYYPGWTRKIYLKGYRYNMHLKPKYLLVEMGAQTNTLEEMKNACDPLAHVLHMVLSGNANPLQ